MASGTKDVDKQKFVRRVSTMSHTLAYAYYTGMYSVYMCTVICILYGTCIKSSAHSITTSYISFLVWNSNMSTV